MRPASTLDQVEDLCSPATRAKLAYPVQMSRRYSSCRALMSLRNIRSTEAPPISRSPRSIVRRLVGHAGKETRTPCWLALCWCRPSDRASTRGGGGRCGMVRADWLANMSRAKSIVPAENSQLNRLATRMTGAPTVCPRRSLSAPRARTSSRRRTSSCRCGFQICTGSRSDLCSGRRRSSAARPTSVGRAPSQSRRAAQACDA